MDNLEAVIVEKSEEESGEEKSEEKSEEESEEDEENLRVNFVILEENEESMTIIQLIRLIKKCSVD